MSSLLSLISHDVTTPTPSRIGPTTEHNKGPNTYYATRTCDGVAPYNNESRNETRPCIHLSDMPPHFHDESDTSSDYFADLRKDQRWRDLVTRTTEAALPEKQVAEAFAYLKTKWRSGLESTDSGNSSPDLIDSLKHHPGWRDVVGSALSPRGNSNTVKTAFLLLQEQGGHNHTRRDRTPPELASHSEADSLQTKATDSSASPYMPSNCGRAHNTNHNDEDLHTESPDPSGNASLNLEDAEGHELGSNASNAMK